MAGISEPPPSPPITVDVTLSVLLISKQGVVGA
jgi:hypothetical protein